MDLQLAMTAQLAIQKMKWNPHAQDPASFFSDFSLQAAHTGRPTSLAANNTVNIVDGMACIPPWFLSRMTAPTAITTWIKFLTLFTNQYNFKKVIGALSRAPGGPAVPRQTYSGQQNHSNVCSPHIHGAVFLQILIGITRFKFHREATHLTFLWTCTSCDHDQYLPRYTCHIEETALERFCCQCN